MDLLTKDFKHVTLIADGIKINKHLPKWVNAEAAIKGNTKNNEDDDFDTAPISIQESRWNNDKDIFSQFDYSAFAKAGAKELTRLLLKTGANNLNSSPNAFSVSSNFSKTQANTTGVLLSAIQTGFNKIKSKIDDINKVNAIDFFNDVKLSCKESAQTYLNRVDKYLSAIHSATVTGQTALLENLFKNLVANKYESVLYAEKMYYVVSEEQIVEFAKKTERGLSLDYIANFARPLPQDLVVKIEEINKLEIFDNYAVLHYDPQGKSYKPTKREIEKQRDPILFGLIAGSDKLYYIADWVDETCDLTLDKFVDALNIDKENLKIK